MSVCFFRLCMLQLRQQSLVPGVCWVSRCTPSMRLSLAGDPLPKSLGRRAGEENKKKPFSVFEVNSTAGDAQNGHLLGVSIFCPNYVTEGVLAGPVTHSPQTLRGVSVSKV